MSESKSTLKRTTQDLFAITNLSKEPRLGVKVLSPNTVLPSYAHPGDSGMDIYSVWGFTLEPGQRKLIKTGIALQIPSGYEVQVRSRSGLALKKGVVVLNSPGTIDQAYTGEVGVILVNNSNEQYRSNGEDAIAQLVLCKVSQAKIEQVDYLGESERGADGFGSTDSVQKDFPIRKARGNKFNEVNYDID